MAKTQTEIELRQLEVMNREQLIAALVQMGTCLNVRFTQEWLEDKPMDRLRVLWLTARLLEVMRQKRPATAPRRGAGDWCLGNHTEEFVS
jgi:hypothetical protein